MSRSVPRGYLLLIALECLQWRVPGNSVSSDLLLLPLWIAQAKTRTSSASAFVHLLESVSQERVLPGARKALSKTIPLTFDRVQKSDGRKDFRQT